MDIFDITDPFMHFTSATLATMHNVTIFQCLIFQSHKRTYEYQNIAQYFGHINKHHDLAHHQEMALATRFTAVSDVSQRYLIAISNDRFGFIRRCCFFFLLLRNKIRWRTEQYRGSISRPTKHPAGDKMRLWHVTKCRHRTDTEVWAYQISPPFM